MSHQLVILVGNLGADPEIGTTKSGSTVTNFRMATNRQWKDKSGNTQKETTWWRISVFGPQAEPCAKYLKKGEQVYVEGEVISDDDGNPRVWEDRNGKPRASFEVRARNVRFLGGGRSSGGGDGDGYDSRGDGVEDGIPW